VPKTLKICMFTLTPCGDNYINVRKVAATLAQNGYEVKIIAIQGPALLPTYEENPDFRIFRTEDLVYSENALVKYLTNAVRSIRNLGSKPKSEQCTTPDNEKSATPDNKVSQPNSEIKPGTLTWLLRPLQKLYRKIYYKNGIKSSLPAPTGWLLKKFNAILRSPFMIMAFRWNMYLDYWVQSFNIARKERADIYYAHDLVTLPIAWLCSRLYHAKLIYEIHDLWFEFRAERQPWLRDYCVNHIESFLIRRTDANIVAGISAGHWLSNRYSIPEPVVLLNVPLYEVYRPSNVFRETFNIPADKIILLYMGSVNPCKGIEQAISSLKYLENCCLVIFGAGTDVFKAELKEWAISENVSKIIYFFEAVPFEQVASNAMSADISLILQQNVGLGYYFLSPNKLFESMIAGLPVVASNFPDLKYFIENYRLGITCDSTKPEEVAAAVKNLLADTDKLKVIRQNALEAGKIFNWENESKKLLDTVSSVIKS
jgi:glycosyltransferase involved in cell wall biosynthesis